MSPEEVRPGMRVWVMYYHRVEQRRDLVGTVVARYGGVDYMAVEVHLVVPHSTVEGSQAA
jgi:hypothetical protein